jgi:hypothetical protein
LMGDYGAGRLIGVIPSEEKSKQWESELDKRGYHRLANAVRDYRENTNAMWESGKQLAMGADPALSESQQQELKEAQQTKPGEAGSLGGGLVSFLGPMGIAESAGAKVASTGMKLLPRIAARLGQGALTSAPHAFREYNDIKQQLIENGESEEDAESQALQQAAKDFGVSAPTTALLFSEKFGKAFMPTTKAMAFANRAARTGIITSAQVGLSNIVNDRPVTDNFMSTLLQNGVFEMSHVFGDAKMGKRGAEIAKKYASLEEAKKALQADYVLAVMDHDAFRTKDTKTDLNNAIADLATLNTWGDRLKFNGNLTAEEASKTQGGIKTLARRSVKLAEMGKGGTEEPAKPTEAITPQETASTEQTLTRKQRLGEYVKQAGWEELRPMVTDKLQDAFDRDMELTRNNLVEINSQKEVLQDEFNSLLEKARKRMPATQRREATIDDLIAFMENRPSMKAAIDRINDANSDLEARLSRARDAENATLDRWRDVARSNNVLKEMPNAVQEQSAREMGTQPRGTEGVGEQAGGVRQGQQGVEPARAQVGPEVAKPEVLAQGEEGKVANHPEIPESSPKAVMARVATKLLKPVSGHIPDKIKDIKGLLPSGEDFTIPVSELSADPTRFQYKGRNETTGVNQINKETGASGALAGVKVWNKESAGTVSVWRDPADGKVYVVNGHNRYDLAQRLGVKRMKVRFIDANNAAEAKNVGAIQNIASGKGTAMDAATLFRDGGYKTEDLERIGIPTQKGVVTNGLALSDLSGQWFEAAKIDPDIERLAVETGKAGLSKEQQGMALQELHTILQKKGAEDISSPFWRDMLDRIKGSQVRTSAEGGLFGEEESYQSTLEQQTDLIRFIRSKLRTDKTVGNVLTGGRYEESVGKAATVNKEAAAGIKQNAVSNLGMFESMKHLAGVGDVINDYAYRLSQAHSNKEAESIRHEALSSVKDSIKEMQGGNKPVNLEAQGEEGKVANHPESSSVQKGEAGFISKEMLGMDPELYKAIYGIAIKKMGLPEGATPADIANHVMGKIKTLGKNVAETTAKILTQIKGITRDAASRLAQILHDNFSVQGGRKNITLEEGGKNGAERGRPGTLEVSGREKPTEDRPAEISESQEGRVARQARLDATDAGSPTLLGPNLSLIEHHSVESKAVKTPRLGYDAVFFHSPDGSIAVVAARDGKRAYVTGNVESNGDITIGELEGNKVKGVGTDLIQTLVREANGRFPETRGKETKGYAEGSTEEGPEGIHRMFNRFKSTLWSEDHKVSVLSDDIADSQFKHVESVKPEDVKSQIRDFYAGDANKYNRADLYKNPDIWTSKTPEEVNDFLLKHSEAKLDVKDPQFLADTFGGQHVYERIIKKMGLPEDASLRQIGEFTMGKIKSLGKTVAETTNKILSRVAGIGRQAAEKLAQFLHNEWESFKNRDGQQGAVTMGNLKKKAVKIATQQLSDEVLTSVKPEDRTRAENMARMGLYAGEGSKYWKNMTPEQQRGIVEAQDAFIAQTKKALASFNPTSKFGRVRKTTAEYDRSRAIAFATKKYIDLRNDTLVEMERAGKIKLDPIERLNIHATQQLSDGLFADVSGKPIEEQRKYAQHLHRELARHSQGLDFATKHAANEVLDSQDGIDGNVAKEAYDFMDRVNAGLPVEESKLSKEAKDYIEKFVKPMQQINNGLYQVCQDMVGGDTVKDTAHIPHRFIGVVDEEGNIQPANKRMGLYRMRGIKPGAKNEIARTVEAGITEKGQRLILNLTGDESASVWENGERIGTAHKTKNEAGEEVWTFQEKGAYGKPIEMKLGRATIEEIEKNTPFRYAHNPVVALTDSIVGLSEASRAKAMIDALVTSNIVRHSMDAPKGWVVLELSNVKDMMAPPDIASVLNDFHRSLNRRKDSSELVRAAKQMGRAFVNLGFINPMVHMPNVIAHGVTGRGAMAWLKPKSYASVAAALESSMESMGDTRSNRLIRKGHDRLMAAVGVNVDPFRNRVFRNLVGLSGRMMNLDPKRTISLKSYNRIMGETIDAQPEAAKNLFVKYGIKSMDAVREAVNDMSDKVWMADNMVRSTMYLDAIAKAGVPVERMAGELTAKERELAQRAVEQVDRDGYPDYDIPAVGTMGRLGAHMKDSPLWLFTRFHWNTVKLVKNDTVDALKSINPKAWATPEGRKEIYHAADKVAAYVLMSAVIYPIMDIVYQKATGLDEEEIEFRRGGAFGAGHAVAGLFSGEQRAVGKFMNHMFTPSLPFSIGMDLYNSATSPMTGEEIGSLAKLRKTGEDIADNDFTGAAGDLGSFVMDVPEYLFFKAFSPAGTIRQGMKDYKGVQREDSEKAKAVLAAMFMGKVKNPNAEMRTEKNYQRALRKIAKEEGND